MTDYSEGYLNLKTLVADLWAALMNNDLGQARVICDCIVVEARVTKAQIGVQKEASHVDQ
jgi:hypothetical protein